MDHGVDVGLSDGERPLGSTVDKHIYLFIPHDGPKSLVLKGIYIYCEW
jgi:hypothetical protein